MHETRLNLLNQQLKEILNGHCILRQIGRNLFFGVRKLDMLKINHRFRGILGEESSLSFARITPYAVQHKYSSPSGGRIKFIRFFNAEPYYWFSIYPSSCYCFLLAVVRVRSKSCLSTGSQCFGSCSKRRSLS